MTTGQTAVPRARAGKAATADVFLFSLVVAAAVAIGWVTASRAHGLIPAQNALFGADTGRVLGDLTGESANYYRLKVHPWQGWICILYQLTARVFGVAPEVGVPALSVLIAAGCAALLFVVMRRLAIGPWAATCFALLFCSTAGFVFWSAIPETHMAGGVTTLVMILLLAGTSRGSRWRSIVALAAGFSMVVTDGAVWALKQIEFGPLRSGLRPFFSANLAKLAALIRPTAWSIGLVFLVWAPQWLFLHKRIGIPFNFLEERHYVELGLQSGSWSLHALGLLPPGPALGAVLSLASLGALIASLWFLKPQLWFIPLFPVFGVCLHTIYGSDSAFLFSPNYLPMCIVAFALLAKETMPRWFPAAVVPVAAMLLLFNLQQWQGEMDALNAGGQMQTYAAAVHF